MTDLAGRYRQLIRAYPAEHRAHREEEMVGALLDASRPGQAWPAPRESVAILANGWRVRASSATEWQQGVALASVVATAIAAAIAVAVLGIALLPPVGAGGSSFWHGYGPVAVSALALAALGFAGAARSRRAPMALGGLVLAASLMGGSELVGVRRSVAVPLACFVLLAAAGAGRRRPWRLARLGALVAGLAGGGWLVWRAVALFGLDHPSLSGASPWGDRWLFLPYASRLPETWWWLLVVASLVAGLVRPRFAVAGALLCMPLLPLTSWSFSGSWVVERGLRLAVVLAVLLAVAGVRGWLTGPPERASDGPGEA